MVVNGVCVTDVAGREIDGGFTCKIIANGVPNESEAIARSCRCEIGWCRSGVLEPRDLFFRSNLVS